MPNSCRNILKKLLYKGALTAQEYEKILRNLYTDDIVYCCDCKYCEQAASLSLWCHRNPPDSFKVEMGGFCKWGKNKYESD